MLDGVYSETADGVILSFDRRMDRPIETLWAVLTTPERLADWMGQAEIDLRVGGRFHLRWSNGQGSMDGVITALDPPRLFEHTWEENIGVPVSRVRWTLEPDGAGCRVRLEHVFTSVDDRNLIGFAGGWEDFLDIIPTVAGGSPNHGDMEKVRGLMRGYAEKFGVDTAAPG
jgi:uncharacterized protein YndB with AHSA1/START domain